MTNKPEVKHEESKHHFVIPLPDTDAVLEYALADSADSITTVDFYRTYVPESYRGKGLSEALVYAGLKWAKAQGYTMTASCWYVQKFLR